MLLTGFPRRLTLLLCAIVTAVVLWTSVSNSPITITDGDLLNWHPGFKPLELDHRPEYKQTGAHPKHHEIFSASTIDRKFFSLKFGSQSATNANIIPSAIHDDRWVIVAVMQSSDVPHTLWFAELVCDAQFVDGKLSCLKEPMILPIASTNSELCTGAGFGFWGLNVGPHDGRVFYGPEHSYIIFGSNSKYNCFGLFMQDMRMLLDWGIPVWPDEYFRLPTDLARPGPHNPLVEKNWFAFWDAEKNLYIHYDTFPRRSFAQVDKNGTATTADLGLAVEENDVACLKKHLPEVPEDDHDNTFHQATNSLAITLCRREDPSCQVSENNTFVMAIMQNKIFRDGHAEYEPYVYLFNQWTPFQLYGVSSKPFWVHGREEFSMPEQTVEHSQMFYITSMSWKNHTQKYHGYIDDILFIAFGIEDDRPGAIDIVAGDLLQTIGLCETH